MPRVLITDGLSAAGLKILQETPGVEPVVKDGLTPEQVREELSQADGIIVRSKTKLTAKILEGQKRLRVIVRAGVGVDNIDLPAATREGIIVMNTPAGNTISTAEQTLALMLALSRNIAPAAAAMKAGKWDRNKFTGTQLAGKTLGVVGLGRIGLAVARRAVALEMTVVGYDPFFSAEKAAEQGIELVRDVDELIPRVDYLTVHTPLTPETENLIDAARIAKMRKGVRIINCARGGIVNEDALADALESGHVAGAALDVFVEEPPPADHRLRKLDNALLTPHLGASTDEAQESVGVEAAELIVAYLTRNEIRAAVNTAPISGAEMAEMRLYLDLGYRLGRLLAQLGKSHPVRRARLQYRGEVAHKKTKLVTGAFAAGLLADAVEQVNLINAELMATDRGIELIETTSSESGDFATMVSATVEGGDGQAISASGTLFGHEYVRLVRLDGFHLDSYLDGHLIVYRHRDVPGLIGYIGTVLGKHQVNISDMALGRERNEPGGDSVAILNVDSAPTAEALAEIAKHPEVTGVQLVKLPPRGAALPGVMARPE
ncbi:MAG TPA: phosphoglycerate dehydrogenase [Planctomycetaceae bacterium]